MWKAAFKILSENDNVICFKRIVQYTLRVGGNVGDAWRWSKVVDGEEKCYGIIVCLYKCISVEFQSFLY